MSSALTHVIAVRPSISTRQRRVIDRHGPCITPQAACSPVSTIAWRRSVSSVQAMAVRAPRAWSTRRTVKVQAVEQLTAEELEVAIQERDRPLVIDFFATWCGPCVLLASELEKVAEELGDKVRIVKVDTDAEPTLASQLQIQGLPTMVFVGLDKAKPALRTEGLLPSERIIDIINGL